MATQNLYVYIMGRGHSGTTVLDSLIGNGDEVESVGELTSAMRNWKSRSCSCGKPVSQCKFWQQVVSTYEHNAKQTWHESAKISEEQADIRNYFSTLFSSPDKPWVCKLLEINACLLNSICSASCGKRIVVDSSKEVTKALFLSRFMPNSFVIHLVRHPEGVVSSYYDRIKRRGWGMTLLKRSFHPGRFLFAAMALTAISWVVGNLLAEIAYYRARVRCIRIRFEDLSNNPSFELRRLQEFLGCNLENVIENIKSGSPMHIGHNIGGDDMRLGGTFIFNPKAVHRRHLPLHYKIMTRFLTWPMLWRYGYRAIRPGLIE
jgi:Sulfotransferase family